MYKFFVSELPVRLVEGSGDHKGRVEVRFKGKWGTVCDDGWNMKAGNVVCRMLGYNKALAVPHSARFGQGTGDITLDDIRCTGKEKRIAECSHRELMTHDCGHQEDAGVICAGSNYSFKFIFTS